MQWTNGQQEALTLLSEWEKLDVYANPDDSIFTLSGAAGTGKTTVVQEIINLFKKYKKQILEFKNGNEYIQKIDEILIDNFT